MKSDLRELQSKIKDRILRLERERRENDPDAGVKITAGVGSVFLGVIGLMFYQTIVQLIGEVAMWGALAFAIMLAAGVHTRLFYWLRGVLSADVRKDRAYLAQIDQVIQLQQVYLKMVEQHLDVLEQIEAGVIKEDEARLARLAVKVRHVGKKADEAYTVFFYEEASPDLFEITGEEDPDIAAAFLELEAEEAAKKNTTPADTASGEVVQEEEEPVEVPYH